MDINNISEIDVPRLFNNLENIATPHERRQYLEDEILKLLDRGELCLTHILNQRDPIHHMAVDVMVGSGISDGDDGHKKGKFHTDFEVNEAFEEARVTIASVTGETMEYIDGFEDIKGAVRSVGRKRHNIRQRRERVKKIKRKEAKVPLRTGIILLQQSGAFVKYAPTKGMQSKYWKVAEVHPLLPWCKTEKPAEKPAEEPPKGGKK